MSGYLQRLVDTAVGRRDAVHPRTGSIFSPRLDERRAPLQGWEETGHVALAQPAPDSHATPLALEPLEPPRGVSQGSEHAPLLPKSVAPERRAAAQVPPFLPPVSDSAGDPEGPFDDRTPEPVAATQRHPPATDADVHITVPVPRSREGGDAFRPVMKPARVFEAVTHAPESGDMPRQRHAARAAQQPDDIQIHIGRIEVTAVPPPAPRAPKAPDRSLSLDAYLSRRDGRTR